jgi:hypothetical protein
MLAKEHPDVTYMKQEEISLVLSRSLCQTYLTKPKDPIDFFAKTLLGYANATKAH